MDGEFKFQPDQMVRHKASELARAVVAYQALLTDPSGSSRYYGIEVLTDEGRVHMSLVPEHVLEAVSGSPDVEVLAAAKEVLIAQQNFEAAGQVRNHMDRLKKKQGA